MVDRRQQQKRALADWLSGAFSPFGSVVCVIAILFGGTLVSVDSYVALAELGFVGRGLLPWHRSGPGCPPFLAIASQFWCFLSSLFLFFRSVLSCSIFLSFLEIGKPAPGPDMETSC